MAAIARELSRDYGVLEPIQTQQSLDGQVRELRDVLADQGTVPVTLIGHSWGAWLAFILSARYCDMVRKLILVSSGPFEERYVRQVQDNRLSRLCPDERGEYQRLLERLNAPDTTGKDHLLQRLDALVSKTDNVEPISIATDEQDAIAVDGDLHQAVWTEAATLRRTGALLAYAGDITCPIVAIHGDHDPHPASGVQEPLQQASRSFRFVLLGNCGHSPWKERYARDQFYAILRHEIASG